MINYLKSSLSTIGWSLHTTCFGIGSISISRSKTSAWNGRKTRLDSEATTFFTSKYRLSFGKNFTHLCWYVRKWSKLNAITNPNDKALIKITLCFKIMKLDLKGQYSKVKILNGLPCVEGYENSVPPCVLSGD